MTPDIMYRPDGRTVADILGEIAKKAEFYTPEWRLEVVDGKVPEPDGGSALAQLFAEMFCGTVDRYDRCYDKYFLEFLNVLGVFAKSVSPASGIAGAELVGGVESNVFIGKGTRLFTDIPDGEDGGRRVVFETDAGFFATPAKVRRLFMTDPVNDVITRCEPHSEDFSGVSLFAPDRRDNIERHRFAVSESSVLRLKSPAEITLRIQDTGMSFRNEDHAKFLSDPEFAQWSFFDGEGYVRLNAERFGSDIVLYKGAGAVALTDGQGNVTEDGGEHWLFCDIKKPGAADEVTADRILLSSRSVEDQETDRYLLPDRLLSDDEEIPLSGGYCFGRELSPYNCFYICSDEAFSKRGAEVTLELYIGSAVIQDSVPAEEEQNIDFNQKMVVAKDEIKPRKPDDVYISDVVWEYWNGSGWALLRVSGAANPFSCQGEAGKKVLSFTCPDDIEESMQGAYGGLWIRARIKETANRYSAYYRTLAPLFKSISISYDYGERFLFAQRVVSENSLRLLEYRPRNAELEMTLFRRFPEKHHAVYLMFDLPPEGYPVNLYAELAGNTPDERVLSFEYLSGDAAGHLSWNELKVTDRTNSLENSGIISVYAPKDFARAELFGETGCWIRIINRSMRFDPVCRFYPQLTGIRENAVEITQKETVRDEPHTLEGGKAEQTIRLLNYPVIGCELWVDELAGTPLSELRELEDKGMARAAADENGQLAEFWVKWTPKISLSDSGAYDRDYSIDLMTGEIRFGDGVNGRIPSYRAEARVLADYSFGGGSAGNLPAGSITGSIESIPFVDSFTNIIPTCGGSNGQSIAAIRRIGTKRIKHRGRAVTAEDFEALIPEEFCEVSEVRCFTNYDKECVRRNGYVTVVAMPEDLENTVYGMSLCRRIDAFVRERASCELTGGGRLSVVPAVPVYISSDVSVELEDYDLAAETEALILKTLSGLLESPEMRRIGVLPDRSGVMAALKKVPNISFVSRVVLTGDYYRDGRRITVSLDDSIDYRYLVPANGKHTVRIKG